MERTISDDSGSKSFDGTSSETLKDTSTEKRIVGFCVATPHIGAKEESERTDESRSLSKDQGQWNPDKVAQSQGEDIVVGQERDLVNGSSENFGVGEEERRETG
jgi:hypothetical protein